MEQTADALSAAGLAALIQLKSRIPAKSHKVIDAYMHSVKDENLAVAAPEARAYEAQTTGVTDLLHGLGGKFEGEKKDLENGEAEAKHSFERLAMDLRQQIESATTARTEKAEAKARALQASADAKGALADTTGTRDADDKYVTDLITTCEQKSAAFAERQQLRSDEIAAVKQATEILAGGAVSGASEKNLPQLVQISAKRGTALVQLRSGAQTPSQLKVAAYLKTQAVKINSRVLSALATRVSADPFKKVKKMVKDLIVKLMEEAQAETEQKGWCDTEMSTNKHTREEKTEAVETLHAEIEGLTSSIAKLTEDVERVSKQISELDAAMAEAIKLRSEEKAKNEVTITDAKAGQAAVANAIGVLKDFYDEAAKATAFTQTTAKAKAGTKQPE